MNASEALEGIEAFVSAAPARVEEAHGLLRSEIEEGFASPPALSAVLSAQEAEKAARNVRNVLDATSGQSPEAQFDAVRMIAQMNLRQALSNGRSTSGIHDLITAYGQDAWVRIAGMVGVL